MVGGGGGGGGLSPFISVCVIAMHSQIHRGVSKSPSEGLKTLYEA